MQKQKLGPFYVCVLSAAFYLHSYRVLNDSMLIIVRDDAFAEKTLVAIDKDKSSRTSSIESFKTR